MIKEFFKAWWFQWTWAAKAAPIGIVVGIILFIALIGSIDSCRSRNTEKKKDEIKANVKEQETIANVLVNQKANIESGIKENENNKNIAVNNFNSSLRRDSSTFSTDELESKFCRRNCHDSTCQKWLERNPDYFCP